MTESQVMHRFRTTSVSGRKYEIFRYKCLFICYGLAVLLSGCSGFSIERTLYEIGEHYRLESCRKDLSREDCGDTERIRYDDYQVRREHQ